MKPPSMAAERAAKEHQRREEELEAALHTSFVATPVPASTFMNKYALMVEEWRERRKAVHRRAQDRAQAVRAQSAFARLSAQSLRHTRQQWRQGCGASSIDRAFRASDTSLDVDESYACDGYAARMIGKSAPHDSQTIPQDDEVHDGHHHSGEHVRPSSPVRAVREIPLEVRMRLWPAVEEHEQIRKERLKSRARAQHERMDAEARRVLPVVLSPTPMRMPEFHAEFDYQTLLQSNRSQNNPPSRTRPIHTPFHPPHRRRRRRRRPLLHSRPYLPAPSRAARRPTASLRCPLLLPLRVRRPPPLRAPSHPPHRRTPPRAPARQSRALYLRCGPVYPTLS